MRLSRKRRHVAAACLAAGVVLLAAASALAQARPPRLMPFLCRDAVVRESAERFVLMARDATTPTAVVFNRPVSVPEERVEVSNTVQAVRTLMAYLPKISGGQCRMIKPDAAATAEGPRIFVGGLSDPAALFPELAKADAHGFVIATRPGPKGPDLYLVGASGMGAHYAAWFFLMNYAGLRVVLPGDIGEVYPRLDRLEIPRDLYVFNPGPDFLLRIGTGPPEMRPASFLADIGGDSVRFEYHHNAFIVYDPARFGQTHPEYYGRVQGKPQVPKPGVIGGWQPTFSEPATVQRAIEYADEVFTGQPRMRSISLTINDGGGYSDADMRKGAVLPDGRVSLSNVYAAYVNSVAKAVKAKWPGRCVAFLPYGFMSDAPDFPLEDNVMVFLFNEPKPACKAWEGKAKRLGIYQWLYGYGWVIPNHWPHAAQDYLRWVRNHGAAAFKGETYAAWAHDGPKMWVLNNLLWNVDADVDALLADFYEHAYGKEAAGAMARYFGQAESIYERRRTPEEFRLADWHPRERQFERATEQDFRIMAQALDEAARLAQGEENRTRVSYVARCFRWAELYWTQYAALKKLLSANVASDAEASEVIRTAATFFELGPLRDRHYREQIEVLPQVCVYSAVPDKVDWNQVDPSFAWNDLEGGMDQGLGIVSAFMSKTAPPAQVADFWSGIGRKHPALAPYVETQRLRLLFPGRPLKNLMANPSLEEPADPKDAQEVVQGWKVYHNQMMDAVVFRDADVKRSGAASVSARGITNYSGIQRYVPLRNQTRCRLSFWYRTARGTPRGVVVIHNRRPAYINEALPPADEWTRYEKVFTVDKVGEPVLFVLALRHGSTDNSQIWFDDVCLEMLSPEGVEPD